MREEEEGSKQREEWPERARTGVCPWVKRVRITARFSSGTEDGAACHMARPPPPPPPPALGRVMDFDLLRTPIAVDSLG